MKQSFIKPLAGMLLVLMLMLTAVGCGDDGATDYVSPIPTSPTLVDATGSIFIGDWNVSAVNSSITALTFDESGSVIVITPNGRLGGTFVVVDDSHLDLTISSQTMNATYVAQDDTITLTTDSDTLILTRA